MFLLPSPFCLIEIRVSQAIQHLSFHAAPMTNFKPVTHYAKISELKCYLRGDKEKLRAAQVPVVAENLLDGTAQVKYISWCEHPVQVQCLECHVFYLLCFISSYS